jgi:argonaute-like protein implicated in RNA metabolism and viral defense
MQSKVASSIRATCLSDHRTDRGDAKGRVTRRSQSNQHRKVEQARAVVAQALGDAARRDGPQAAATYVPITKPPEPDQLKNEAIGVLTLREAATRLGISTGEMEGMVKRGAVKSVMTGWTMFVPTRQIERLARV